VVGFLVMWVLATSIFLWSIFSFSEIIYSLCLKTPSRRFCNSRPPQCCSALIVFWDNLISLSLLSWIHIQNGCPLSMTSWTSLVRSSIILLVGSTSIWTKHLKIFSCCCNNCL
jgi:hypothetical protein